MTFLVSMCTNVHSYENLQSVTTDMSQDGFEMCIYIYVYDMVVHRLKMTGAYPIVAEKPDVKIQKGTTVYASRKSSDCISAVVFWASYSA